MPGVKTKGSSLAEGFEKKPFWEKRFLLLSRFAGSRSRESVFLGHSYFRRDGLRVGCATEGAENRMEARRSMPVIEFYYYLI
jgi:hypothetical protein